jgi:hypothetical protein
MKTIFLLETAENVLRALEHPKAPQEVVCFVSLRPAASYELERRGITFSTRSDYFDRDEANRIGMENDRNIQWISKIFDIYLASTKNYARICPATDCFFSIKLLYDSTLIHAAVIRKIMEKEEPHCIRIFNRHAHRDNESLLPFINEESIYAEILHYTDGIIQVEVLPDTVASWKDKKEENAAPAIIPRSPRGWFRYLPFRDLIFNFGLIAKRKGFQSSLQAFFHRLFHHQNMNIILFHGGYNWDDSLTCLYNCGIKNIFRLQHIPDLPSVKKDHLLKKKIVEFCENSPEIRKSAICGGIDLSPIIIPKLAELIDNSIRRSLTAYAATEECIQKNQINALLLSTRDMPEESAVIRAARDHNIPVISWQHGGAGYFDLPLLMYSELKGSDIHLVFGEGVRETYEITCRNHPQFPSPAIIPVGSSSLDNIKQSLKERKTSAKIRVLYISTVYHTNLFYHPFRTNGGDFDESLWTFQKGMLDLASSHPECEFTVKLYPSHRSREPLLSYITDHAITNVKLVVTENTVIELLDEADVVVLDMVTTAILQVLRTRNEVFVYTGIYAPDFAAYSSLTKRAHTYRQDIDCIQAIGNFLNGRPPEDSVDPANTEFLQRYGTFANDQQSAKRAVEIVTQTILNRGKNE